MADQRTHIQKHVFKKLGIAVGIPFGIIALVIGLASVKSVYALYGLGLIAVLLFLTWLFVMAVYRGKHEAEFVLDDKGVLCRTQAKRAEKNRIANALTVVLGLLSGKPEHFIDLCRAVPFVYMLNGADM
jgi:hypothetical protein